MRRLPLSRDGLLKMPVVPPAAKTTTQAIVDRGVGQAVPATSGAETRTVAQHWPRVRSLPGVAEWFTRFSRSTAARASSSSLPADDEQVTGTAVHDCANAWNTGEAARKAKVRPVLKDHGRRGDLPARPRATIKPLALAAALEALVKDKPQLRLRSQPKREDDGGCRRWRFTRGNRYPSP